VTCADLEEPASEAVATAIREAGGEAIAVTMDHTNAADCERTVAAATGAFGGVDILVNNAGVAIFGAALNVSEEDFLRQLRINVVGPFLMTRAALPSMIERGGGAVVMIASAAGLQARQSGAPYVTSKHALIGLTRSLAVDYARYGIRVNAVCPGLIRTRMSAEYIDYRARKLDKTNEEIATDMAREFPLGRLGAPEDVAAATLHFASDEASWITGETYLLDGGQSLLGPRAALPSERTTESS
jgi:NAD(P)-dependent dehydrogenase (short-subunit alcohol dehydrogenase family)